MSERGPWFTAWMVCAICNRKWVATYPWSAPRVECPGCHYMNENPVALERDEDEREEPED